MIKFDDKTLERFSRQIIIDKVGIKGQKKIVDTSLAIIGCGGLGLRCSIFNDGRNR